MNLTHRLKQLYPFQDQIVLRGQVVTIRDVISYGISKGTVNLSFSKQHKDLIEKCYQEVLRHIKEGQSIYGISTAYGAQGVASPFLTTESDRLERSNNLSKAIVHVDVSVGTPLPKEITNAAMLLRLHTLTRGVSGVSLGDIELFCRFLNTPYTPIVGQFGSLGASGDLAQNGRVLSVLLQNKAASVWNKDGTILSAEKALEKSGIPPLTLHAKSGLAFVNGDNFSVAAALFFTVESTLLLLLHSALTAVVIQALKGTNQSFHPALSDLKPHAGQRFANTLMRRFLTGSKLSYDELSHAQPRGPLEKVQDVYSLRCFSQFTGPDWEKLDRAWSVMDIAINSVSDNPIFLPPRDKGKQKRQWVSGGNFLGMYAADTLDDVRKILTRIVKVNDRHLALLVSSKASSGLPPNLSDKEAISSCTMKGLQNQMGMMEVYASVLSVPVTTFFGVHEEGNQDVTAHGLTSWILGKQLLELTRYSLATNLIACMQAVDLRGGKNLLSPNTQFLYDFVRSQVPYIKKEQPLGFYIEKVHDRIHSIPNLLSLLKTTLQ